MLRLLHTATASTMSWFPPLPAGACKLLPVLVSALPRCAGLVYGFGDIVMRHADKSMLMALAGLLIVLAARVVATRRRAVRATRRMPARITFQQSPRPRIDPESLS